MRVLTPSNASASADIMTTKEHSPNPGPEAACPEYMPHATLPQNHQCQRREDDRDRRRGSPSERSLRRPAHSIGVVGVTRPERRVPEPSVGPLIELPQPADRGELPQTHDVRSVICVDVTTRSAPGEVRRVREQGDRLIGELEFDVTRTTVQLDRPEWHPRSFDRCRGLRIVPANVGGDGDGHLTRRADAEPKAIAARIRCVAQDGNGAEAPSAGYECFATSRTDLDGGVFW